MIVKVFSDKAIEPPMNFVLQPWHLMVIFIASWINRKQLEAIEYLRTGRQDRNHRAPRRLASIVSPSCVSLAF
jgi:hypothetical protein